MIIISKTRKELSVGLRESYVFAYSVMDEPMHNNKINPEDDLLLHIKPYGILIVIHPYTWLKT